MGKQVTLQLAALESRVKALEEGKTAPRLFKFFTSAAQESPRPAWATWPEPNNYQICVSEAAARSARRDSCYAALDSRPGSDPVRDPEKARDVIEAIMRYYHADPPAFRDEFWIGVRNACAAYAKAQRGE